MSFLSKLFGDPNSREISGIRKVIDQVTALEPGVQALSDEALKAKTAEFKDRIAKGETLDALLPEAFAVAREASRRVLKQRQYDVQLMGGVVLHRGSIAEMRTGEGKTLTAVAPVYLNALAGKGVHLVTVNDYLARRDAVWMGQVYDALGLTVGCIQHEGGFRYDAAFKAEPAHDAERDATGSFRVDMDYLRPASRRDAYDADITYGTNNEFGFDYLRDHMVAKATDTVQRGLAFAIVDEVDSILIDEARTPLIISAPAEDPGELYYRFAELVAKLAAPEDYTVDEKQRAVTISAAGIAKMEQWLGIENLYAQGGVRTVHHLEQALRAHALFKRDKDYVVKDGEVVIVDEFTGRMMEGRRYSEGLHQAIEAKERVEIQRESVTMATITFQNFFRMYGKLAGMTGTAVTEAEEFFKIYKLEVTQIPTNKTPQRVDAPDRVYKSELGKFQAVVREIKERRAKGQPVLVGTASIEKNEILGELLRRENIPFNLLNAKNHEKEAEFIAQAGRRGAVTVATNMAGRGVDILLGGNPQDPEEAAAVRALGGLHVIGTERHESRRIDNQLRGRAGRQGDPGSTQFFVSVEDDLIRIFGAHERMKKSMEVLKVPEDEPIESGMLSRVIESAQKKVEGHNFDIRKHLLEYDDVLNKHRMAIYQRRRDILAQAAQPTQEGERPLKAQIMEAIEHEVEQVVAFHTMDGVPEDWDAAPLAQALKAVFPPSAPIEAALAAGTTGAKSKQDVAAARTILIEKLMEVAKSAYAEIEGVVGDSVRMAQLESSILVGAIDVLWVEHLEAVEHMRRGIGLQGYGQRDPLVEYKKEAYRLYSELLALIDKHAALGIFRAHMMANRATQELQTALGNATVQLEGPPKEGDAQTAADVAMPEATLTAVPTMGSASMSVPMSSSSAPAAAAKPAGGLTKEQMEKTGRNDLCPCGSGKKFKKCHGA
jgi:preprotein translocase subunit SecA